MNDETDSVKYSLHKLAMVAAMLLFLGAALGCNDDPDVDPIPGGNNGSADAVDSLDDGSLDSGDITEMEDVTDTGETDIGFDADADAGEGRTDLCDREELGQIPAGGAESATVEFGQPQLEVGLSCTSGEGTRAVFSFTLSEPSEVDLSVTSPDSTDWSFQINRGACASTSEVVCFNSAQETFFLDDGVRYFAIVETPDDVTDGEVELQIDTDPIACYPVGSASCDGDDVQFCESGFTVTTQTCSMGCRLNGCSGDTCENALGRGTQSGRTLEGSWEEYRNQFDFSGRSECFESGSALPTDGPDIVVDLDDLTAGQTVRVDTNIEDGADNAIFILEECADTPACVTGTDVDTYEWTVPDDGDYILVIDTVSVSDDAFTYQIDIEDPQ